jgi:hypothetical protein
MAPSAIQLAANEPSTTGTSSCITVSWVLVPIKPDPTRSTVPDDTASAIAARREKTAARIVAIAKMIYPIRVPKRPSIQTDHALNDPRTSGSSPGPSAITVTPITETSVPSPGIANAAHARIGSLWA